MNLQNYKKIYNDELTNHVLPFWQSNSLDTVNGGIYTCLDEKGMVFSTDKSVWAQGRTAWIFAYLSNTYGTNAEWLSLSRNCLDFIEKYCIDKTDGRMYFTVTADGKPLRKRRYFFSETFYIIGCAEYYIASGNNRYIDIAKKYYELVWDIYKNPQSDPFQIHPKSYGTTRETIPFAFPMILLNVTAVMRRCDKQNIELYNKRSTELVETIRTKFMKPELNAVLETVGPNGEFLSDFSGGRVVNPGHAIEGSWFLLAEKEFLKDDSLIDTAKMMFDWSIEKGWDKEYGGILYFVDVLGKPPEQYEHDMKLWWPHCEALIASLMLYRQTGCQKYFDWFEKIHEYSFKYLSDHTCGDWYGYLRRDGKPTLPACKGSTYKSGFHLIRALIMIEQML